MVQAGGVSSGGKEAPRQLMCRWNGCSIGDRLADGELGSAVPPSPVRVPAEPFEMVKRRYLNPTG
jgi:hypothetical protein